jgi:hypothetical protein
MKALLQTGSSGRVPVPPEKRFLINSISLAAAGDELFVCDRVLRRIARLRMDYRTTAAAVMP